MERCKKVIRDILICASIVIVTVIIDYFVQDYVYKNKYKRVEDDFSHVFQIDSIEQQNNELILTGWVFELEKDSVEEDFEIILYDYNNDKDYYMNTEDVVREDVNEYFLCEYDYSNSGFVASMKLDKLNLDNTNYEVLIRQKDTKNTYRIVRKAYHTGVYISNDEIKCVKPEEYVALDVKGTVLEDIVNNGVLRVYRPDVGMYIYQFAGNLYWIADENYAFEEDGRTYISFQLQTTQIDRLPKHRLDNNNFFDNIGFVFEENEIEYEEVKDYRVAVSLLPTEYSIQKIRTGYHVEKWIWWQDFRPYYEF